jgi:hypothetical protein
MFLGDAFSARMSNVGLAVAEQSARAPAVSERCVGTGEEARDVAVQA